MLRQRRLRSVFFLAIPLIIGVVITVASESYTTTVKNTILDYPGCLHVTQTTLYGFPFAWFSETNEFVFQGPNCPPILTTSEFPAVWLMGSFLLDVLFYGVAYYSLVIVFLGVSRKSAWVWTP
jgi:hypothetical protein